MIYGAGTARSGARTLARYLNDAGFDVGYEATCGCGCYYCNDSQAIKRAYLDLGKGDISYLTVFALDEIMEVNPDARFIHYTRHPYEVITSLVSGGVGPLDEVLEGKPQCRVTAWTPRTGLWHGYVAASVGVVSQVLRLRDAHWPEVRFYDSDNLVQQVARYWSLVHERILAFTGTLDPSRYMRISLEDIYKRAPLLLSWLGSDLRPEIHHLNKRLYVKAPLPEKGKRQAAEICGALMSRLGYAA